MKEIELRQLFKNKSDCYADTWHSERGFMEEGDIIQAMTEDRFIEVLMEANLLSIFNTESNMTQEKRLRLATLLMQGLNIDEVSELLILLIKERQNWFKTEVKKITVDTNLSFWFMRDNNTFCKPNGNNLDDIKTDLLRIAKENPYGMICPVTILHRGQDVRKVGPVVHVDGKGNVDLSEWYKEIIKDDFVRDYFNV